MMSKHVRIMMKTSFCAAFIVFFLIQTAVADDIRAAEITLKNTLNAALAVMQKKDVDLQVKKNEIDAIMMPIFDFPLMAKLTLGKKYWPRLGVEDKKKFEELFPKLLKRSYQDRLIRYTDETVVFESPVKSNNKIKIQTYLISKEDKTSMLYKLYQHDKEWKIYDVEIEGVSIIRSYQSQFDHILQTGTVDDLMVKLEKSVKD